MSEIISVSEHQQIIQASVAPNSLSKGPLHELFVIMKVQACVRRWIARKNYLKTRRLLIRLQAIVRAFIVGRKLSKKAKRYAIRIRVAQEIVASEKAYMKDIRSTLEAFFAPMAKKGITLPPGVVQIYGDLEIIYGVHKSLYAKWKENLKDFNMRTGAFGSIILAEVENFSVYEQYINNYNQAMDLITLKRREDPDYDNYLKKTECTKKARGQDISSMLIQPVQRLPRYAMLLQEYLKHTSPKNSDYEDTATALAKIKHLISSFNESKRRSVNMEAKQKIMSSVSGLNLMAFDGESDFVMEGELILSRKLPSSERVYFYLFKEMIIWAKTTESIRDTVKKSFKKLFHSKLYSLKLENIIKTKDIRKIEDSDNPSFVLITKSKEFNLVAPSVQKKNDWITQIRKVMPKVDQIQKETDEKVVDKKVAGSLPNI